MEMKHLPPFMTHREVFSHYLRIPPETTLGRHVSIQSFHRVWAKYFPNVVTPKTKRFSQCDICSQLKEFLGRNIEVEVREYKTIEDQIAHRQKYSDRAKYIADLKNNHFRRVSIHQRLLDSVSLSSSSTDFKNRYMSRNNSILVQIGIER